MDGMGTSRISCDFGEVSDHSLPMREGAGLSQQDLCRAIGSSTVGRVWAWEAWSDSPRPKSARDPHLMGFSTAKVLADELGMTLDDFWSGLDDATGFQRLANTR